MAGSSDLYAPGRQPYHSINFITSHDGFTLNDLVTYTHKHNEANGEDNRDGDNNNLSDNYGIEGPTNKRLIEKIRSRQIRNFLSTLFLSQGVPMLVYGDECRRTQRGNNNAYCQDNEISWFDWDLVADHVDLVRFTRALVAFRKRQPTLRRSSFLRGEPQAPGTLPDISWFDSEGGPVDWSGDELSLTCLLAAPQTSSTGDRPRHILIFTHAGTLPRDFALPSPARKIAWPVHQHGCRESQGRLPQSGRSRVAGRSKSHAHRSLAGLLRLGSVIRPPYLPAAAVRIGAAAVRYRPEKLKTSGGAGPSAAEYRCCANFIVRVSGSATSPRASEGLDG